MYMSKKERALRKEVRKMSATDVHTYRMYLAEVRAATYAHVAAGTWDTNLACFEELSEAQSVVDYWDSLYNPAPELPLEEQLDRAQHALRREEDLFDNYTGSNPNKYVKSMRRLFDEVNILERKIGAK